MQYTWYFSELWNETMWLYTYLWQNTHFNVSVTNDKLQDANEFPHPPPNSFCAHTHTHTHICTQVHTHAHTHQCPDKPGLWKDTCCSLNKIKSNTTWRGVTRVYSSNCWSAEITYSNPKGYWFGFIQKVQISLCMMAEVGSIQVRILPGTPS